MIDPRRPRAAGAAVAVAARGFDVLSSDAVTGAQPHATCDVPALSDAATIRSWQGTDPFYAYVPFQKAAVGVDDRAASWLPVVQARTGLDLATIPDAGLEAACEGLPGATPSSYVPADATQTSFHSLASHTVAEATAPLHASIATLQQQMSSLGAVHANASAHAGDVQAAYDAALAEIETLRRALRPLRVSLPRTIPSVARLAGDGVALAMAGPAKRTVTARLMTGAADARRLGLRSRVLARTRVALGADGTARFELTPTRAAAAGLARASGPLPLAVDARSGDRFNLVSAVAGG